MKGIIRENVNCKDNHIPFSLRNGIIDDRKPIFVIQVQGRGNFRIGENRT